MSEMIDVKTEKLEQIKKILERPEDPWHRLGMVLCLFAGEMVDLELKERQSKKGKGK